MKIYNNKRMQFFYYLSKSLFCIIALVNLLAPLRGNTWLHPDVFQFALIAIWFYGMLCSLGYLKKETSDEVKGVIKYEISIPIVQIGFLRIGQCFYYLLLKKEVSLSVFCVLCCLDLLYLIIILIDKSNYYYESVEVEDK